MVEGRTRRLGLAAAILASLALDAWTKGPGNLGQMLWTCHWASSLLLLGLLFRVTFLVEAGFLFHISVGFPAWALGVIFTGQTYTSSVLVHVVPLLAGLVAVQGSRAIRWKALWLAWATFAVSLPVAAWFTPPALNVNLAHAVWEPLQPWTAPLWTFHLVLLTVVWAALATGRTALNYWLAARPAVYSGENGLPL